MSPASPNRPVAPGMPAPAFELPDADMEFVSLDGFRGRSVVVLYFYPKDNTPGCTAQGIEFSERFEAFEALGAVVLGVSRDDCLTHSEFRDEHGLAVRLLSDEEGEVCARYGVIQEREVDGRKRMGIMRSTFVIDRKGIVRHALYGVKPQGNAADVLELVRDLK